MKVTKSNLAKLKNKYATYLEGEKINEFFDDFEINFASGHWAAGDFCDRFAPAGYNSNSPEFDNSVVAQIERVSKAGIKGIEFHEAVFIDKNYKLDENKLKEVKDALSRFKIIPTNMNINLFSDPKWKLGSVTNPDKNIRKDAIDIVLQAVDIAEKIGCSSVGFWPGSDGWDYNFEVNYGKQFNWFIEACILVNKKAKSKGLKFGIEAKLKEPREGNMVVSSTHMAMLVAKLVNEECGGKNMGICIDYGHEQMVGLEPASMLYLAKIANIPVVNFHINNAKYKSNDEDRIAGTGDNWKLADFCYAAIDTGYSGWFGEDQFTYRTEPIKSMELTKELFANIMKKALIIYANRGSLLKAQETGDAAKTIDIVKKVLI